MSINIFSIVVPAESSTEPAKTEKPKDPPRRESIRQKFSKLLSRLGFKVNP